MSETSATISMGVVDPSAWGEVHTNVVEGPGADRTAETVASETSELFVALHGAQRVVIGDVVIQAARADTTLEAGTNFAHARAPYQATLPGTPVSHRYVTHRAPGGELGFA